MSSSLRKAFSFHSGLRKQRIGIMLIAAFSITTAVAFGSVLALASGGPDVIKIVGTSSSPAGVSNPNGQEQNWFVDSAVASGATFAVNVSVSIDVNGNTAVPYPRTISLGQGPGGSGTLGAISDCVFTSSATSCTRTLAVTAPVTPGTYLIKVDVSGGASPQSGLLSGNGLNIHYDVSAPPANCNAVGTSLSVDALHVIYHQPSVTLSATLTRTSDQTALAGQTIRFDIGGNPVGTGTTGSDGTATYVLDTSLIPVGNYTINAFFDGIPCEFNASSNSATLCVTYATVTFRPPIDPTGPALFRSVKTIPVKIIVTDYWGIAVTDAQAYVFFAKYSSSTTTDVDAPADPLANTNGDNGNMMRFSDGQYIFNWNTTGLTDGKYRITIVLGEGSCADPHTADVTFKRK
jgi:hypothetical protein